MQQLVGRLTALDPEASATLKVVAYFDTLAGYDPRTPDGRTRYVLARTLQRVRNAPPL
jgi:hypothetical protein